MTEFLSRRVRGLEKTLLRRIHDLGDSSCIDLGLGQPVFPTPKSLLDLLKERILDWDLGYTPNAGLAELREMIAQRSSLGVSADQVCITVGSEEAMFLALLSLTDEGDEILLPDPGFPAYGSIVRIVGGVPRYYRLHPENNFSLVADDVKEVLTPKSKAIVVNSPNNPSGAVYSGEELLRLSELLLSRKIIAISDEVYSDIYYDEKPDSMARCYPHSVVIDSLSKSYSMTGWRLGWCIAPPGLVKAIVSLHQLAAICAPTLSQRMALLVLEGYADKEKMENIQELRRRRNLATSLIEKSMGLDYIKPAGTFYLLLDISGLLPRYGSSLDIALKLLNEEKVITIPGTAFGQGGEGYLRLSFAASSENIKEGIRRIAHFCRRQEG